jgi:ribosomal-protein-alanine N-acetyltransferase
MSVVRTAVTLPAGVSIDRMVEHDLLEVVEIEESTGLSPWGWDGYRTELDRPESIMIVARLPRADRATGRLIIGFVAARADGEEMHINNIGVRESARRTGVGSALLTEALGLGHVAGARRVILEVRASNLAAQALYGRHGFAAAGRRRNYYRSPTEDALVMSAEIRPQA